MSTAWEGGRNLTWCDLGQVSFCGPLFLQWLMAELGGRASLVGRKDGSSHVPAVRRVGEEAAV